MELSTIDSSIINNFISSGHWQVALVLMLLQVVFIPLVIWIAKHFTEKQRKVIDLERENTKLLRDKKFQEVDTRIEKVELTQKLQSEELYKIIGSIDKKVNRMFDKLDKIDEDLGSVKIGMAVIEAKK